MVKVKENLTGMVFGKLTVIESAPNHIRPNGEQRTAWKCHCECGNDVVVTSSELKRNRTKSCGCLRKGSKKRKNEFTGMSFGYLEVLKETNSKQGRRWWLCKCECGSLVEVRQDHLLDGHTASCGCINSMGEKEINEYLLKNKIEFVTQKAFEGLIGVGGGKLTYDFYLPNLNTLIEYQGKQHFEPVKHFGGKEKYNIQINHDFLKKEYAKINDIVLVCIPYWDYDKISIILEKICYQNIT